VLKRLGLPVVFGAFGWRQPFVLITLQVGLVPNASHHPCVVMFSLCYSMFVICVVTV
jgi:hypothetical protein